MLEALVETSVSVTHLHVLEPQSWDSLFYFTRPKGQCSRVFMQDLLVCSMQFVPNLSVPYQVKRPLGSEHIICSGRRTLAKQLPALAEATSVRCPRFSPYACNLAPRCLLSSFGTEDKTHL